MECNKLGYQQFDDVLGHDEYLFQILKHNKSLSLPALNMIRFHFFYP